MKKCVKMRVMLFKNWKHVFKHIYQIAPKKLEYEILSAKHIQSRRVFKAQELIKKMVTTLAEGQSEEPTIMLMLNLWTLQNAGP